MNKIKQIAYAVLTIALVALPAMAQGAADNESTVSSYKAIAAGLGFGLPPALPLSARDSSVRVRPKAARNRVQIRPFRPS